MSADPHPLVGQRHAGQARVAVVQRRHGVEQVGHPRDAGVDAGTGLGGRRRRVARPTRRPRGRRARGPRRGRPAARGPGSRGRRRPRPTSPRRPPARARRHQVLRRSWAPRRSGARNGPLEVEARAAWRPWAVVGGPGRRAASARRRTAGGAVTIVGSQAVTPHRGRAAATSHSRSGSVVRSMPDGAVALQVDEPRRDQQPGGIEPGVDGPTVCARCAAGRREMSPGGRVGVVLDGCIDHGTLGPGTDRAVFDATVGPIVPCPRSANAAEDVDDAAGGDEHVGPFRSARPEDRTAPHPRVLTSCPTPQRPGP